MRITTDDLVVDLPEGWALGAMPGADALAYGTALHGRYQPTVVVSSEASTASLAAVTTHAIEDLQRSVPTAAVVGVDPWDGQVDDDGTGVAGRQLTFTVGLDHGQQATLTHWLWRVGDRLVTLAASVGTADTLVQAGLLHDVVVGARLLAPAAGAVVHEPLESLAWVADRQRYDLTGRSASATALAALAGGDDERHAALGELGLLREGVATDFGGAVVRSRTTDGPSVRIRTWHGRAHSEIRFTPLDRGHVVEAGPPAWRLARQDAGAWRPGTVELDAVSFDAAPARAAAWLGLGPSWALHHEPIRLERRHLDHHVRVESMRPPPSLDATAEALWTQPWTHHLIEVGPREGEPTLALELVAAGRLGVYGVDAEGDEVVLRPIRTLTAYHRLLQAFGVPIPQRESEAAASV